MTWLSAGKTAVPRFARDDGCRFPIPYSRFPTMDPLSDEKVIDSWHTNAAPWTSAIREQRIESRKLVTDRAIIDAVMSRRPESVLDLGCGEGWLVRALAAHGIPKVVGVDVVPALVEQ